VIASAIAELFQSPIQQSGEGSASPPRQDPSPTDTPNPNQFMNGESWGAAIIRTRKEPFECIVGNASTEIASDGVVQATELGWRGDDQTLSTRRKDGAGGGGSRGDGSLNVGASSVS
jgi:hypothetical protein